MASCSGVAASGGACSLPLVALPLSGWLLAGLLWVKREKSGNWAPARRVKGLFNQEDRSHSDAPPPLPTPSERPSHTCPKCHEPLAKTASICMNCGYDRTTNESLGKTHEPRTEAEQDDDLDPLERSLGAACVVYGFGILIAMLGIGWIRPVQGDYLFLELRTDASREVFPFAATASVVLAGWALSTRSPGARKEILLLLVFIVFAITFFYPTRESLPGAIAIGMGVGGIFMMCRLKHAPLLCATCLTLLPIVAMYQFVRSFLGIHSQAQNFQRVDFQWGLFLTGFLKIVFCFCAIPVALLWFGRWFWAESMAPPEEEET